MSELRVYTESNPEVAEAQARIETRKQRPPCPKCGGHRPNNGPDPCTGMMTVTSFCCGHGTEMAFCVTKDEQGRLWHWQPRDKYPEPVVPRVG